MLYHCLGRAVSRIRRKSREAARETKAEIRESKHCNWQRDRKRIAMDRDRRKNAQRCSRRSRRSVGRGSVILTPRPRASAWYERVGTDPALLLLRGDPGWSPRPAWTSPAIKRSDKAAMFICRDRGKKKREGCRVEGEIYLPAARADKIIRQKTPGVDDGEARGGGGLRSGRRERRKKERRGNERRRDRPVRPARMGKESCIADTVDAATHEREERTKDTGTTRKGGNRTGMHGRMRRVTGYPTATLISRESE